MFKKIQIIKRIICKDKKLIIVENKHIFQQKKNKGKRDHQQNNTKSSIRRHITNKNISIKTKTITTLTSNTQNQNKDIIGESSKLSRHPHDPTEIRRKRGRKARSSDDDTTIKEQKRSTLSWTTKRWTRCALNQRSMIPVRPTTHCYGTNSGTVTSHKTHRHRIESEPKNHRENKIMCIRFNLDRFLS